MFILLLTDQDLRKKDNRNQNNVALKYCFGYKYNTLIANLCIMHIVCLYTT